MFEMFRNIRQMAGLMGQMPKIREEMDRLQQTLGQLSAEGDAGAGMVKVRVSGRLEVLGVSIGDELLKQPDREMLEQLLKAAVNQGMEKARQLAAAETRKMAENLGLPPGMALPGMG
jgi:DNA-binding YbaB/EbfC family protein